MPKWTKKIYMSYATGHNSFTSQYLLNIYIYCRFCRLCIINMQKKNLASPYPIPRTCSSSWFCTVLSHVTSAGPYRKHHFQQFLYCCIICLSSYYLVAYDFFWLHYFGFQVSCHNILFDRLQPIFNDFINVNIQQHWLWRTDLSNSFVYIGVL
jgi:hypothetical protein